MSIRKYTILTSSETSTIDFSQVLETSLNTLRYNKDRTKTFVKYEGPQPSFLSGKTEYTSSEIKAIIDDVDGEWYIDSAE
tara:strand:- start:40 stop:279 length:240 start_codon:yes stop_codon:yes gene_type:complete